MALSEQEVLAQSRAAMAQWQQTWDANSAENGKRYKADGNSHQDLLFAGAGKTMLCIGLGPSFEHKIDIIKKYCVDNPAVEIGCVDKAFGLLLDHGVKAKYVFIADAGIGPEWIEPYMDKTEGVNLIANVNANPAWTLPWKGKVYFFVNKDNIQTEVRYSGISGCYEQIPASSNVGNTVLVFSTQILGYDQYILVGYDYCWYDSDNYYAFNDSVKRYWMRHMTIIDPFGNIGNTSQNLYFSARWLKDFHDIQLKHHRIKAYNCSGQGVLEIPLASLERKLKSAKVRNMSDNEKQRIFKSLVRKRSFSAREGEEPFKKFIEKEKIVNVDVFYMPQEAHEWVTTL